MPQLHSNMLNLNITSPLPNVSIIYLHHGRKSICHAKRSVCTICNDYVSYEDFPQRGEKNHCIVHPPSSAIINSGLFKQIVLNILFLIHV